MQSFIETQFPVSKLSKERYTERNAVSGQTLTGFGKRHLGGTGFAGSLVRNALFAVREAAANDDPLHGRTCLTNEVPAYWNQRSGLLEILPYLARRGEYLEGWEQDARAAALVAGAVQNDRV